MKYIQVKVKFEASFTYEVEDDEYYEDGSHANMTGETVDSLVTDTIETLSDRSNRYWDDAEFYVAELDPELDFLNNDTVESR